MTTALTEEFLTTVTRAVGVLLLAGLLLPLSRVAVGAYLRYWAIGWAALAVGLLAAYASIKLPDYRTHFVVVYCLSEFAFVWLLWAGCHDATSGRSIRVFQGLVVLVTAGCSVLGPVYFADSRIFFSLHNSLLAALYLLAFLSTLRLPVTDHSPTVGLWVLRASILVFMVLYVLQAALGWGGNSTFLRREYLEQAEPLESLPGVLVEIMLAFGMVLLATDRMREQLQSANRRLQVAADELREAARMDSLTGLQNRLGFEAMLSGGAEAPGSGCIAVLDLNNLKPLNDSHGHAAGDAALKIVARALRTHFRVTDPLFRIGGDEFVVIMTGCDEADLVGRLARIDEALTGQRLPRVGEAVDVVVAWGVAAFAAPGEIQAAFQRADAAMYARKRQLKSGELTPSVPT